METITRFKELLLLQLKEYGFGKKKNNLFTRTVNDCVQHISVLETKVRGKNEVHISVSVGFTYEIVNKTISFLQCGQYDNKWATANINLSTLINSNKVYGFFINDETDANTVSENIVGNIKEYAFAFLNDFDDMDKFYQKLYARDSLVRMSTFALKRPEWNLLALSIILHKEVYEEILNDYLEDFVKNKYIIEEVKNRIKSYNVVEESVLL